MKKSEEWKELHGVMVSSLGRVQSVSGYLAETTLRNGYLTVSANSKTRLVHRLVAEAFFDDYCQDLQVNHKNGVRTDNRAENLEMVTGEENIKHMADNMKTRRASCGFTNTDIAEACFCTEGAVRNARKEGTLKEGVTGLVAFVLQMRLKHLGIDAIDKIIG